MLRVPEESDAPIELNIVPMLECRLFDFDILHHVYVVLDAIGETACEFAACGS
jgi:hypothetical protein